MKTFENILKYSWTALMIIFEFHKEEIVNNLV